MQFIRLIRPVNLFIIALTMYGLGWYFDPMRGCSCTHILPSFSFFLLVFSTVLIAAAGNIINDYFDVRADRVNKPERLIIGKSIKKRVAIVSHWGINLVAFGIAIYLTWEMNSFVYLFIHLLSINILWFYSLYFKRRFLIGNILIAALTALVPVLVGIYFHQMSIIQSSQPEPADFFPFGGSSPYNMFMWISFGLACFAFMLNLAREVVKDFEDMEGDKKIRARTLPLTIGERKSKSFIAIVLLLTLAIVFVLWFQLNSLTFESMIPIFIVSGIILVCLFLLLRAQNKKDYRFINHLIKLSMTIGLLTPVYWKFIQHYV